MDRCVRPTTGLCLRRKKRSTTASHYGPCHKVYPLCRSTRMGNEQARCFASFAATLQYCILIAPKMAHLNTRIPDDA